MTAGAAAGDTAGSLVIVGLIRKPQGLQGELLVEPITDTPDAIFASGRRVFGGTVSGDPDPSAELTVRRARPFKDGYIIGFEGIDGRDAADQWRGRYLFAPREELAPLGSDEVYRHDLIGMQVHDAIAGALGAVVGLHDFPQGLTLEVRGARGSLLLPYRPEIITAVDLAERTIRVAAPEGLLD